MGFSLGVDGKKGGGVGLRDAEEGRLITSELQKHNRE